MSGLFAPFSGALSIYIGLSKIILASSFPGCACFRDRLFKPRFGVVVSMLYTDNKRWNFSSSVQNAANE